MPSSPKNSEDVTEPSVVPHKEISISTSVLHVSHGVQANFGMSHQEALASVTAQAKLKLQSEFQSLPSSNSVSSMTSILPMHQRPFAPACNSSKALEIIDCQNNCTNTETTGASLNTPHNDGFNWRKYGQRPVKGSDCCRSYYRCINSECHVKKRIERYPGGKIKDIGYKGQHNHDPPPRVRNSREGLQASRSSIESDIVIISDRKSSVSYPFSTSKDQIHGHNDDPKQHDSSDGGAIPGTSEMNDDEPDPKRRMAETNTVHQITQLKSDPEPRIILQRETDLGAFNDGYRWRKYGQKIVKGNSNPRSYYKCTVMECPVRKHVERASDNTNTFIITYEGKHNHGPPPGPRNDNDLTSMDGQDSPDTIIPPSEYCADLPITNLSKPKDRHDIESSYLSPSKVDNTVSCKLLAPQLESVKSDSFDEKPMEIGEKRALESAENSSSIDSSSGSLDVSDGKKFDVIDQQILNEKHAAVSV